MTLTDLTAEDAGDYSCLLLALASGEVDKETGLVNVQVRRTMMISVMREKMTSDAHIFKS